MDERFADEFVTWHHKTPIGVKVDEVFGMDSKSGRVWTELARQIYCEQGEPNYRNIGHFDNGAPFIEGYPGRISISHTSHLFVVASLPKTPEVDLSSFSQRAAMGVDAEPVDRGQVLKIRSKFLSPVELEMIPEDDVVKNVIAWTSKEALYKAAMTPGLDFIENLIIKKLPVIDSSPNLTNDRGLGEALIVFPNSAILENQQMILYSYVSYNCIVTIAVAPKCAKFGKK